MSNRRDYFDQPVETQQANALTQAAAALEYDASLLAKQNKRVQASTARYYATVLRAVANGVTWTQAFDFPSGDNP